MEEYLQLLGRRLREEVEATFVYMEAARVWEEHRAHEGAAQRIANCKEDAIKHVVQAWRLSLIVSLFQQQI